MGTTTITVAAGESVGRVSHLDVSALIARVNREHFGFLLDTEIAQLARDPEGRLTQIVVRCGSCRFVCAAQDFDHLESAVKAVGDYVRDASIKPHR